jgi:hypothetical protein
MSEDKKPSWGKSYAANSRRETAPGETGQVGQKISVAPAHGVAGESGEVVCESVACESSGHGDASGGGASRAHSQHVLPGILGKQLRAAYGELLNSPVPDAITELIKKLEAKEAASPAAGAEQPRNEESGQ